MFRFWKKRRPSGGTRTEETFRNPDMVESHAIPCPIKDTIKLVKPSDQDEESPPRIEAKPLEHSPSVFIMQVDDGIDTPTRKLSSCGEVDLPEDIDLQSAPRRASISNVKWATLPKDSERELKMPLGKSSELDINSFQEPPSATSCESGPLTPSPPPSTLVWSIPEEVENSGGEGNTPVNLSSAETDECDTDSMQNKRTRKSQTKQENLNSLTTTFPGLRKDSIDMYKKKKQTQGPGSSRVQESAGTDGKNDANGQEDTKTVPSSAYINLPPLSPSILKRRSSGPIIDKEVRQSVFTILSGMYAMFLTILGAVLPIAEVFAPQKHPLLFEVFYIYMYGGSIIFLGYVYTYLLRTRAAQKTDNPLQKKKRRKRKVSVDKVGSHTGSFYLRLGAVAFGIGSMIHSGLQFGDYFEVEAFDPCAHAVFALRPVVHLIFTFVQLYFVFMNSKMCINKYKVVARFGLMHMVATNICVWFNTIVEETLHQLRAQDSTAHHVLADNLVVHNHPVSVQNHTLLAGGRHNVSDHHVQDRGAREGHEVATALTTTLRHLFGPHVHHPNVTHGGDGLPFPVPFTTTQETPYTCKTSELMMTVLETVGPYLYPCSIEYSLICAGIIYTLWKNIGKRVMTIKSEDGSDDRSQAQRLRVDCSHSSRGLFLGILVLVGTIITMVVFFVLVKTPTYNQSAMLVEYLSEIALFAVSSIAVLIAATRMRYLRFNSARDTDFEEVLILISLSGDYMFQMLSLVAAIFDGEQFASRLSITACLLGIIQSTLQTMFVLDGLRRCSRNPQQSKQKHGRECVTFLLITNIAMWCINTFEAERTVANPVQMHYYGALAWSILTHISIPLGIFFRFHSTVCLSNMWKRAWKSYL